MKPFARSVFLLLMILLASQGALARTVDVPRILYKPFFKEAGETDQWVGPLAVDELPVRNRDYLEFVKLNPRWRKSQVARLLATETYLQHWNEDLGFDKEWNERPVTNVSWFAARAYCEFHGKRLPTVAEWEAVSDAQNPENLKLILDWYSRTGEKVESVKSARVGKYGLRGMHGLIWEWVEDFSSVILSGDSRNGNETKGSLFCGAGSLKAKDPNQYATFMRYAYRSSLSASDTGLSLGFRCVRDNGR